MSVPLGLGSSSAHYLGFCCLWLGKLGHQGYWDASVQPVGCSHRGMIGTASDFRCFNGMNYHSGSCRKCQSWRHWESSHSTPGCSLIAKGRRWILLPHPTPSIALFLGQQRRPGKWRNLAATKANLLYERQQEEKAPSLPQKAMENESRGAWGRVPYSSSNFHSYLQMQFGLLAAPRPFFPSLW